MKSINNLSWADCLFVLLLLFSIFFAPALRAQVLLEENFDAASLGTPPFGWAATGSSVNVDPGQACSGNAVRLNQFASATINNLDTPDLPRGTVSGNVAVSFDMRIADWNNNSQLTGTGRVFVQLFINGAFSQDFIAIDPISLTSGCTTQTASFTTADIPLGADFKIRFLGLWGSGDWALVIDNVDIRIVNDECAHAVVLPQTEQSAFFLLMATDGSFIGATDSGRGGCPGAANDDVWYKFVATERSVDVAVECGDCVVELMEGSCGSLNSLRCVDGSSNNERFTHHGTTIGETYFLRVYTFNGAPLDPAEANFRIQVGTPRSVNNECISATVLTQSSATSCGNDFTVGSLEDATESQPGCAGTANDDIWYEFTATSTNFTVFLESPVTDVVLELFAGNCGSLNSLVCRDFSVRSELLIYENATIGQTYFLRVHSFGGTAVTGTDAEIGICVFTTAASPDNDDCTAAEELIVDPESTCGFPIAGTTNGATRPESDPLCPAISGTTSVWYSFTANATEHLVTIQDIQLLNGTDGAKASFEVFSGDCGARTRVYCSGQLFGSDPAPQLVTGLVPGDEYLIRVVPVNIINTIDFDICVATPCPDPPTNLMVGNLTATTANLSHNYPFGITRTHVVREAGGGATVFSFSNIQATAVATGLSPGTDYEYFVIETCGGASNTIGPVAFTTKQLGDECADAFSLTQSAATSCGTNLTQSTVEGATSSLAGCTGTANDDVWYSFEATSTDFSVFLESGDFVVQLFTGSCGNLTSLVCRDLFFDNETFDFVGATVGETYFLRVYSAGNTPLTGADAEFGICVFTTPEVPANDACANAVNLPVNTSTTCASPTPGTTNGADRTEPDPLCSGITGLESVWYSFTATSTSHLITLSNVDILNGNDGDRASFEVFSGGCGARTRVQCSGQLFGTNPNPVTVSGLTAGQEYLIRVVPVNPWDAIDFDICITTDCPALATGLNVSNVTATTALLGIAETDGEERDFIVVAAGDVPVFGDGSNHVSFISSTSNQVTASGLSSNTTYDFYVGQGCSPSFSGPFTFTTRPSCGDVIYDTGGPSGNYDDNEDYTVTICPETADQSGGPRRVAITFDEFDVEANFDGITIYDGEDTSAPVLTSPGSGTDLWSWSRAENTGGGDLESVTVFTTNASGCITLRFTSDGSVTAPGFKATISCDLTADIFNTILTTVPAGTGTVTADRGYLSTASGYMYYVKEGVGSLLALQLGNTQAIVPLDGVSLVAGSGASNLGQNGCFAPYVTVPDWWVMNRTWDVAATIPPASPVGVRFLYTQEDFDAIVTNSGFNSLTHEQLSFYKINGGDEEDLTAAGNACHDLVDPANYQEFDPGEYVYTDLTGGSPATTAHQAQFELTSFSGGGGGAGTNFGGALPLQFRSFDGFVEDKANRLSWVTSQETGTDYHQLERSADGRNWEAITTLAAAGESEQEVHYEYLDESPLVFALYRIVTFDLDGSTSTSEMVELKRDALQTGLNLGRPIPSPTSGPFSVQVFGSAKGIIKIQLINASGSVLIDRQLLDEGTDQTINFDLSSFPSGLYWLRAIDASGLVSNRPIIRQ